MIETTVRTLRREGEIRLMAAGIENAAFEAQELLAFCLGVARQQLFFIKEPVSHAATQRYTQLLENRCAGEPLQYLLGQWDFCGESFFVGPGVLIPRPETETLAMLALRFTQNIDSPVVWDLCAGTGCIGLTIAKNNPAAQVFCVEKEDAAFGYLQKNAQQFSLPNVQCVQWDITNGVAPGLPAADVLVSNPPYIETGELAALQREVQQEPRSALDGGADGLYFYRILKNLWFRQLRPGGVLLLENGEGQAQAICELFGRGEIRQDLQGIDRFVLLYNNQ